MNILYFCSRTQKCHLLFRNIIYLRNIIKITCLKTMMKMDRLTKDNHYGTFLSACVDPK